jgi:hypothetical protein
MPLEMLVGARVLVAMMRDGSLYFATERGIYRASPEGDCCANCYVQHVSGTDALAPGAIIAAVEDIVLPPVAEEERTDEVSFVWGHRITTDKGICSIEMRVDHNGYYGGNLSVCLLPEETTRVHDDCLAHSRLAAACGCLGKAFGKVLDDF